MNEPPGQPRWIPNENYPPQPQGPPGQPPAGGWAARPAGALPPSPPSRKQHRERNVLVGSGVLLAVLAAVGFAMPGANKTALTNPVAGASASPSPAAVSPAAAVPSAAAPADCATQVRDWFNNGGSSQINSFAADIGALGSATGTLGTDLSDGADATADETTVQSDAASVQSDAQALQGNPPPSCVPGLRTDVEAAAGYYSTSAIDASNCLNQLSAGNMTVADGDIQAATAALDEGNVKLHAATSDVQAFNNGQG